VCDFYVVHGVARGTGTPKDRHEVNRREESPRGTSALAFFLLKKDTKKHVESFHTTLNLNIEAYIISCPFLSWDLLFFGERAGVPRWVWENGSARRRCTYRMTRSYLLGP
jgi:hypothetical protein